MTPSEFLPYYQGIAHTIVVTSTKGLRLQFAAKHMRPYLKNNGINGFFCLETENKKFLSISQVY
jgi:hypothetical protein